MEMIYLDSERVELTEGDNYQSTRTKGKIFSCSTKYGWRFDMNDIVPHGTQRELGNCMKPELAHHITVMCFRCFH